MDQGPKLHEEKRRMDTERINERETRVLIRGRIIAVQDADGKEVVGTGWDT